MAQYSQKLKPEVQNIIISIKNPKDIRELIKQTIEMDNRIYQSKKTKIELSRFL